MTLDVCEPLLPAGRRIRSHHCKEENPRRQVFHLCQHQEHDHNDAEAADAGYDGPLDALEPYILLGEGCAKQKEEIPDGVDKGHPGESRSREGRVFEAVREPREDFDLTLAGQYRPHL